MGPSEVIVDHHAATCIVLSTDHDSEQVPEGN